MNDEKAQTATGPHADRVQTDIRWIAPIQHPLAVTIAGVCGFIAVIAYGFLVSKQPSVTAWNQQILEAINGVHTSTLDSFAYAMTFTFRLPFVLVPLLIITIVAAIAGRRLGDALFVLVNIVVIYECTYYVKYIIQRPRPEVLPHLVPGLYPETDPSFPSGHVAIVASMVLVLFLATRQLKLRWVIAGIGAALVATMMCVRMYVGAHFLDDVVASVVYVSTVGTMLYLGLHWLATRWRTVEKIDSWAARHWGFFA